MDLQGGRGSNGVKMEGGEVKKDEIRERELEAWLVARILETKLGRLWLCERMDVKLVKRVFVVKGGRTVNFVF